ncbi:MAG: hypothetical protein ACYC0F_05055 [Rhodanobacter sp.]
MTKKISELPDSSALDGTELLELVQAGGNVKATSRQVAAAGAGGLAGINDQTGTSYALVLSDAGKDVRCTNAAAIALTVPPNSVVAYPLGTMIAFSQGGVGVVTATAGAGVTINQKSGVATTGQYDARVLEKIGTDTWRVW